MKYCKNCGVELEEDMRICPLCGAAAVSDLPAGEKHAFTPGNEATPLLQKMTKGQKTFVWEIISIILLSAIIATLLINFIINKAITWAEYPVAVCLVIFSFVSFFTFWPRRTLIQIAEGFTTSAILLLIFDSITQGTSWALKIAIPILFIASLITAALFEIIRHSKDKGINLIAYLFAGGALLCISIEGIFSLYRDNHLHLRWSVIVSLCTVLVMIVLLFTHFRLKKGRHLEKTFHI